MKNTPPKMSSASVLNISLIGIFAAISVVSIMLLHFPIIPAAPYLEYDMADVPIMLIAMLINPIAGECVLLIVSLIQAFAFGGNGIIGCIMHFVASSAMVLIMGYVYRKWQKILPHLIIAAVISTLAMTALMIPLNLIFTPILFGMPVSAVKDLIVPVLIPFNLIKAGINCTACVALFAIIKPIYYKIVGDKLAHTSTAA